MKDINNELKTNMNFNWEGQDVSLSVTSPVNIHPGLVCLLANAVKEWNLINQPNLPDPNQIISKDPVLIFDGINSKERTDRMMRAMAEEYQFQPTGKDAEYMCLNKAGRMFTVRINTEKKTGYCDCEDFQNRGMKSAMPCKHIYGLMISLEVKWDETMYAKQDITVSS